MKIDFNETECKAMEAFAKGDSEEGSRLQQQFLAELKQEMRDGLDYCSCDADCELHGKCVLCVQVHRGHGEHLPACMREMVNRRLEQLSSLTEHTLSERIELPPYLK